MSNTNEPAPQAAEHDQAAALPESGLEQASGGTDTTKSDSGFGGFGGGSSGGGGASGSW